MTSFALFFLFTWSCNLVFFFFTLLHQYSWSFAWRINSSQIKSHEKKDNPTSRDLLIDWMAFCIYHPLHLPYSNHSNWLKKCFAFLAGYWSFWFMLLNKIKMARKRVQWYPSIIVIINKRTPIHSLFISLQGKGIWSQLSTWCIF